MIDSPNQTLSDNTTSHQPTVSQSSDTSSDTISNSSTDVKEQHDDTIHKEI